MNGRAHWLAAGWALGVSGAVGVRVWNALAGPLMWGYDAWGHVAYVLFLDLYRGVPWADQGWSYFHPPLHYALGWLLAQAGNGEVLMRGLALLSSAASLGTAALAAMLVRRLFADRPGLALLAFVSVALLPVHLFVSSMPGNELTLAFLTSAALLSFIANEGRDPPRITGDAITGALVGLALLTKFSGLLPLIAFVASLLLRTATTPANARSWRRTLLRAGVLCGTAVALASPYYARNIAEFGTPFQLSRDYPLVAAVERAQPPGVRRLSDYVRLSRKMFEDPDPRARHLLHSVWGSVYVNVWADVTRETDVAPTPASKRELSRASTRMAILGLAPTLLAIAGAGLLARDVLRGRRRAAGIPLLSLAAVVLGAFALFAWRVPQWSALKAAYLLALSLPYAAFLTRSVEALARRAAGWPPTAPTAAVGAAPVAPRVPRAERQVLPARADAPATGAVHFYFGEYDASRRIYTRLIEGSGLPLPWLENLAAVEVASGRPERARTLYTHAAALAQRAGLPDPHRAGRRAVAAALAGDLDAALDLLDAGLKEAPVAQLLANRGAVYAARNDSARAERDLADALAREPALGPAWWNLVVLRTRTGQHALARDAAHLGAIETCRTPRHYPYGLGTGEILEWGVGRRWLLVLGENGLEAALPAFHRGICRALRRDAENA
ncbi:MAG: glycosyltransferase family 39 protein [Myxococcota bacterium]